MSKYARTKGYNFQRFIAKELQLYLGDRFIVQSNTQYRGAKDLSDIVIKQTCNFQVVPVWIECQCSKKITIKKKINQVLRDLINNDYMHFLPIVILKQNRMEIVTYCGGAFEKKDLWGCFEIISKVAATCI